LGLFESGKKSFWFILSEEIESADIKLEKDPAKIINYILEQKNDPELQALIKIICSE
jgi:hypothetical protein